MVTIKKNFEFRKVLSRGNFVNGNNVAIYFFPNKLNVIRYGFAIGKTRCQRDRGWFCRG